MYTRYSNTVISIFASLSDLARVCTLQEGRLASWVFGLAMNKFGWLFLSQKRTSSRNLIATAEKWIQNTRPPILPTNKLLETGAKGVPLDALAGGRRAPGRNCLLARVR